MSNLEEASTEVLGGKQLKDHKPKPEPKVGPEAKVEITVSELTQLMKTMQESSDAKMALALERLGNALIESKKPYVDPRQEANEASMRQSMREQRERQMEQIKADQSWCQHLQGSNALSKIPGTLTSIIRHRLDTGEIVGICTNCIKIFREGDEDYMREMRRASGNELSSAGQRSFIDPTAVKKAGR